MTRQVLKDAENKMELLERARQIALTAAHQNGTVTADSIPAGLRKELGPAAGSIFKTGDFKFTGKRVNSTLPSNHTRELKVWELTSTGQEKMEKQAPDPKPSPKLSPIFPICNRRPDSALYFMATKL